MHLLVIDIMMWRLMQSWKEDYSQVEDRYPREHIHMILIIQKRNQEKKGSRDGERKNPDRP
jgi:hypothetical protein